MLTDLNTVLTDLLVTMLAHAKIGIVVRGISPLDPARIAHAVAVAIKRSLYVAVVGYPITAAFSDSIVTPQIEAAVGWRNEPDKAGCILAFVTGDVEKLASLNFLDAIGPRELAKYWLEQAATQLAVNTPQQQFWRVLAEEAECYPISMLRDFIGAVEAQGSDDLTAIPLNLWRLGLLNDPLILDTTQPLTARMARNRRMVTEAGQLSENSRRRMTTVVGRARSTGATNLVETFHQLLDYYRRGTLQSLSRLTLDNVETLIAEGKNLTLTAMPTLPPAPISPLVADEFSDSVGEETTDDPGLVSDKRLTGRGLQTALARQLVAGTNAEGFYALGERVREAMAQPDQTQKDLQATDLPGFVDHVVSFDRLPRDLYRFVGMCCAPDRWGGVITSEQHDLKDIVKAVAPQQVQAYNPDQPDRDQLSLFGTLRRFDQYLPEGSRFSAILERLITARQELLPYLDLLLVRPEVFLGGYPSAVQSLYTYLGAYTQLYHLLRTYEPQLYGLAHQSIQFVEAELLRLEVIYVQADGEWKALLSPLHPFHLWRYREIIALLDQERSTLSEDEQQQLAQVLPDLPHLLHFVVASMHIVGNQQVILPHAGSIGLLPTYENHTNRYLGNDGLESLVPFLTRWLELTPYAKYQIRLAVVDVPDLVSTLEEISLFLAKTAPRTQIVVDVYYTPARIFTNELAQIDYEQHDGLRELLLAGRLEVGVWRYATLEQVTDALRNRPVHIAFLFDQSQFDIAAAPRISQLLVSPLVITYSYDFDNVRQQGSISPSSEVESGLFADYHYVVERASSLPGGQQLRLKVQAGPRAAICNRIIKDQGAIWLAVADRSLISYAPEEAVPLLEQVAGQREVGLWASNYSQTIRSLLDLLVRYNLKPQWTQVVQLVHTYGHIAAAGLFSVSASRSQPEKRQSQQKGLLGTILAAEWYRRKHPGALVASLDSTMARQWLAKRTEGQGRADLIGLRFTENRAIVEVIEVKSRADATEVQATRNRTTRDYHISGPAVTQLTHTLALLDTIFGDAPGSRLFIPARREALRYQLYRECFRENHNPVEQARWFDVLNAVFKQPADLGIECRGLVIQVVFEENSGEQTTHDSREPISLSKLGTQVIQQLISVDPTPASSEGPTVHPPNTPLRVAGTPPPTVLSVTLLGPEIVPATAPTTSSVSTVDPPVSSSVGQHPPPNIPDIGSASDSRIDKNSVLGIRQDAAAARVVPNQVTVEELKTLAQTFRRTCEDFRINIAECDPSKAAVGPSVIRFYVRLARGQALAPLRARLPDLSLSMKRSGLLVNQLPNSDLIAVDVPRTTRLPVPFRSGLDQLPAITSPEQMPLTIGVTPEGEHIQRDLGQMPHLLVGGTTGAGKTMFLYTLLCSLLARHPTAQTLRLLISTSKAEDFTFFAGLPHLETGRVIDDAAEAVTLIRTLVHTEFEQRKEQLEQAHCRDISEYNRKHDQPLAPIVVMVDEFADLADQLAADRRERDAFYNIIKRIAQLGRSRGVYLILCTQRPSADLVPTFIRTLMNARVALRVNDAAASRMILGEDGAEQLQRHGDLLFKEESQILRAQGYFIDTATGELALLLKELLSS